MNNQERNAFLKCYQVITSCINQEQLLTAQKYIDLYFKEYRFNPFIQEIYDLQKELLEGTEY